MSPSGSEPGSDYRARIYDRYVAVGTCAATANIEAIQVRRPLFHRLIRNFFPMNPDADILDIGCGCGGLIKVAREHGYRRIRGVDVSPEQVEIANRLGIEGIDQKDLFETLRVLEPESHDAIVTFDVIEHLSKEELEILVDQIFRVLRRNGKWIIHVPNGESPLFGRVLYGDFTHQQAFTRASIKQLVFTFGFKDVVFAEDSPIPHGLKSSIRWVLWKLLRAMLRLWLLIESGTGSRECIFTQNFVAVAEK